MNFNLFCSALMVKNSVTDSENGEFTEKEKTGNCYEDDNISYIASDNIDDLINLLEKASTVLIEWFHDNPLSANPTKWSNTLNLSAAA